MSKELNVLLREKITETNFILAKYQNHDSKDQWNCITSCMDWIDVGATNINQALDELNQSKGLETCMKFYQYICCIDMIWEGICKLHKVFIDRKTIPFQKDSTVFQKKYFSEDDNCYFKELRACFGAHSVNLKSEKEQHGVRRFASWSGHFGSPQTMSVLIYSNIPNSKSEEVTVTIDELQNFYARRFQYIKVIIEKIDQIVLGHKQEMKNCIIPKTIDFKEQIEILKTESQKRFGGTVFIEELEQIDHFLSTQFDCSKNKAAIETFRKKIIFGINEIYTCLQNMNIDCDLEIAKILLPKYMPQENQFGYDFANLYSKTILKVWKPLSINGIKCALKKYICFEFKTQEEFYWLVIIALNLAQEDLKEKYNQQKRDLISALDLFDFIEKNGDNKK